jgi:four helix bundle protein
VAKVERFEDLDCWKAGRELVNLVFDLCEKHGLAKDFDTKSQLKRASVSTMNNVAEGFGRYSATEFVRFLNIAQSSALEVRSMAYILLDRKYITQEEFSSLEEKTNKVINLNNGFVRYLISKHKKKLNDKTI